MIHHSLRRTVCFVVFLAGTLLTISSAAFASTSVGINPQDVQLGDLRADENRTVPFTLTNSGTTDITFGEEFPFGVDYPSVPCRVAGRDIFVVHPGETCTPDMLVALSSLAPPNARGPTSAAVSIVINGGELVLPITLHFNAVPRLLDIDTGSVDVGELQIGDRAVVTRTVQNNTANPIDISTLVSALPADCYLGGIQDALCAREVQEVIASYELHDEGCHPVPAFGSCNLSVFVSPRIAYDIQASVVVGVPADPLSPNLSFFVRARGIPRQTMPGTVLAVEYTRNGLPSEHYFITADANEKQLLDTGRFPGWSRTGRSFWVFPPGGGAVVGAVPVCRFYGRPAGQDSHFYSASAAECQAVAARFGDVWLLESTDVFEVYLPDTQTGVCPGGTAPVYRLYNNRADVNHRYVTDSGLRDRMAAGYTVQVGSVTFITVSPWIREGYGRDTVALCAPQ